VATAATRVDELAFHLTSPDPVRGAAAELELRALTVGPGSEKLTLGLLTLLGRDHWASVPRVARLLGSGDDAAVASLVSVLERRSDNTRQGAAMAFRYHRGAPVAESIAPLLGETSPHHAIRALGNCGEAGAAALLTGQTSWLLGGEPIEPVLAEALETLLLSQDSDGDAREVGNALSTYAARHGTPFVSPPVTYVHRVGRGWIDLAIDLLDTLAAEGMPDVLSERAILWLGLARVARGVPALGHVAGSEKVPTPFRVAALNALAENGRDGSLAFVARAAGIRVAEDDPAFGAMQSAIDLATARLCGQDVDPAALVRPVLERAESAGNVRAAGVALRALGRYGESEDAGALEARLTAPDATLRVSAAAGLGALLGTRALSAIKEAESEASAALEQLHLAATLAQLEPAYADRLHEQLCRVQPPDRSLWMLEQPYQQEIVDAFHADRTRQIAWQAVLHHPEVPALDEQWLDLDLLSDVVSAPSQEAATRELVTGTSAGTEPPSSSEPEQPVLEPADGNSTVIDAEHPGEAQAAGTATSSATADGARPDVGSVPPTQRPGVGHGTQGRPHGQHDEPTTDDQLGRKSLVEILCAMLDEPDQGTPFTIALFGAWGAGKSSVLYQLKAGLQEASRPTHEWKVAEFNAWRYEKADNLAAGLVEEAVKAIVPSGWWRKLGFRLRYAWATNKWRLLWTLVVLLVSLAAAVWGLVTGAAGDSIARIFLGLGGISVFSIVATMLVKLYQHPVSVELMTYFRLPTYGEHLGLLETMKVQLDRIWRLSRPDNSRRRRSRRKKPRKPQRLLVLVDDLDRCSTRAIAATFDAIRLVMGLDEVVVIIALDERIGLGAIALEYEELALDGRPATDVARDFLAKVVQLSVRLPPPSAIDTFVRESLFAGVHSTGGGSDGTSPGRSGGAMSTGRDAAVPPAAASDGARGIEVSEQPGATGGRTAGPLAAEPLEAVGAGGTADRGEQSTGLGFANAPGSEGTYTAEAADETARNLLAVTMREGPDEIEKFLQLARHCGLTNPRQLRRLRNSYRFVKAATPTRLHWDGLMTMLFWQEELHARPIGEHRSQLAALDVSRTASLPPELVTDVERLLTDPSDYVAYRDAVLLTVLPRLELGEVTQPATNAPPSTAPAARA
jgi:hypothetical protein